MQIFLSRMYDKYRYSLILLRELVLTDFKLRYQGSVLGYLWSLLRPLALFLILYVVFVRFLKIGADIPHYPIYLLLGIVLWNYFAEVTGLGLGSIVGRGDILRKINFPKYVIVVAGSFSSLINLIINLLVIAIFMIISGVDISPYAYLAPLLIIEMFVFGLGISFLLSALFVRFRDVNYIWEVIMQGAFYATPILYPLAIVPAYAAKILVLNPMAQIVQDMRYLLVTPVTPTVSSVYGDWRAHLVPVAIVLIVAIGSGVYFKARSKYFAEEI